ncbi:MAG TPA: inositol-3-phosphate synthase [Steroidobacter sp.]|jgi:myo-inositol-1-phosphate synthase|nr:inositol-3-phosphate synthase [Steroidobacteraceae bacterium]HLS80233.1 inositol-3-phosphate synthase [Steroidobacter sp.]
MPLHACRSHDGAGAPYVAAAHRWTCNLEESALNQNSIRVGIVGAGNCASSFVQGLQYYRDAEPLETIPGLMNPMVDRYHVADICISSAFDVSARKVGKDLSEALGAAPNNTLEFAPIPPLGVTVERGPTLDGIGEHLREDVIESPTAAADVGQVLRSTSTQVLVSYLPVGSQRATEWYAERALEAGCAFVNCIPVFIASNADWRRRFEQARLPLIGDDVKSQVGATIVHRVLANLFRERGVRLDRTYQLNFGGNADFKNMLERERLVSKKLSKTRSVTSQVEVAAQNIHVGPSDHVEWLSDRKWAYIRMEGTAFGGAPLNIELKLEVWDSPNSAGVVIDAVRCARLALDRGLGGAIVGPSSYFMKSPPQQFPDHVARRLTLEFIAGASSVDSDAPEGGEAIDSNRRGRDEHAVSARTSRRVRANG